MQTRIQGTTMPVLEVQLDPNESVFSESGELSWMTQSIQMTTHTQMGGGGGLFGVFKRAVAGGSIFMTEYRALQYPGEVAFATKVPGHIVPVQLGQGMEYMVHRHGFLCATPQVTLGIGFQQSLGAGIFGGDGFILQRVGGMGTAWLELSGELIQKNLAPGEVLRVHPGHVGAFQASVAIPDHHGPGHQEHDLRRGRSLPRRSSWDRARSGCKPCPFRGSPIKSVNTCRIEAARSPLQPAPGSSAASWAPSSAEAATSSGRKQGMIKTDRSLRGDILFGFAIAFAIYLAWVLRHVLLLLYLSALFAVVLQPLATFIAGIRIGRFRPFRKLGIFMLLLFVVGGLIAFGFLAIPPAARDLQSFAQDLPSRLPGILDKLKRIPFAGRVDTSYLATRIEAGATQTATYVFLSIKGWAGTLFDVAMTLILTIYFSLEGDVAYRWFLSFVPVGERLRLDSALRRAESRMQRWLLGQGSLMLILGMTSTVVYGMLHVRYAYALGFLTGLLNIIPVVGAAVSIALALLVAAVDSWGRVLGIAIFYVIYLNLENSFLVPRIMQSRVNLPGLAILCALLIGSAFAGVAGALVAVPTAALVAVLVDEYLVAKDNGL